MKSAMSAFPSSRSSEGGQQKGDRQYLLLILYVSVWMGCMYHVEMRAAAAAAASSTRYDPHPLGTHIAPDALHV